MHVSEKRSILLPTYRKRPQKTNRFSTVRPLLTAERVNAFKMKKKKKNFRPWRDWKSPNSAAGSLTECASRRNETYKAKRRKREINRALHHSSSSLVTHGDCSPYRCVCCLETCRLFPAVVIGPTGRTLDQVKKEGKEKQKITFTTTFFITLWWWKWSGQNSLSFAFGWFCLVFLSIRYVTYKFFIFFFNFERNTPYTSSFWRFSGGVQVPVLRPSLFFFLSSFPYSR